MSIEKLKETTYRNKDYLKVLDEINILNKYFYLSPDNKITVNNGMTNLTIRMVILEDKDGCIITKFKCLNENFPDLPEYDYTDSMTLDTMEVCIRQLKKQEPVEIKNGRFKNRWEEIRDITLAQVALNSV